MITVVLFALAVAAFVLSLALETVRPPLAALLMLTAMAIVVVMGLRLTRPSTPEQARQTNALATLEAQAAKAATAAGATE